MKKLQWALYAVILTLVLSSCGVNTALILNHNNNATQVQLSNNNFKVLQKVSGSADVSYVLMFGGINKKHLYESAYSDMMEKAPLMEGSRALINFVTEEHLGGFPPFYFTRTVTVSAHLIEFTK